MLAAAALSASCYCGAIRLCVDAARPPLSVSICHCATCRRLTGGPFLANLMLPAESLTLDPADAPLVTTQTSKHVARHRCASCHSPVYANLGKGRVVVPMSLFDPPLLSAGHRSWPSRGRLRVVAPPAKPTSVGSQSVECMSSEVVVIDCHVLVASLIAMIP